jgi:hypothetical protein
MSPVNHMAYVSVTVHFFSNLCQFYDSIMLYLYTCLCLYDMHWNNFTFSTFILKPSLLSRIELQRFKRVLALHLPPTLWISHYDVGPSHDDCFGSNSSSSPQKWTISLCLGGERTERSTQAVSEGITWQKLLLLCYS